MGLVFGHQDEHYFSLCFGFGFRFRSPEVIKNLTQKKIKRQTSFSKMNNKISQKNIYTFSSDMMNTKNNAGLSMK